MQPWVPFIVGVEKITTRVTWKRLEVSYSSFDSNEARDCWGRMKDRMLAMVTPPKMNECVSLTRNHFKKKRSSSKHDCFLRGYVSFSGGVFHIVNEVIF